MIQVNASILHARIRGLSGPGAATDPDELVGQLNECLDHASDAVTAHDGAIVGAEGECITACFGSADGSDGHELQACLAAGVLLDRISDLVASGSLRTPRPVEATVGIASGAVVLGHVGPAGRRVPAALGETVRLASSLEGLTRRLGTPVVLARTTAREVDVSLVRELGWIEVRGIDEPVRIATLVGRGELDSDQLDVDVLDIA